jgi:formamidopyrimidine-DNA glycosylase
MGERGAAVSGGTRRGAQCIAPPRRRHPANPPTPMRVARRMPELPEAETIARGLRAPATGARLVGARVLHGDVLDVSPAALDRGIRGRRIAQVTRRGKNVVLRLDDGQHLVVNLGMSGRLLWMSSDAPGPPPSHPAVIFTLRREAEPRPAPAPGMGGGEIVYHDPRRFGRIQLLPAEAFEQWSRTLGPEPLSRAFTAAILARALARSRSPVRSWLLDQRRVAGVGNIYASEACFRARIHPQTPASAIDAAGARRLHRALRKVLGDAVEAGGTTLRDYRTAQGWEGSYQRRLEVYGRAGEPCPRCGRELRRVVFSNRSAFYCPRCQPEPDPTG